MYLHNTPPFIINSDGRVTTNSPLYGTSIGSADRFGNINNMFRQKVGSINIFGEVTDNSGRGIGYASGFSTFRSNQLANDDWYLRRKEKDRELFNSYLPTYKSPEKAHQLLNWPIEIRRLL